MTAPITSVEPATATRRVSLQDQVRAPVATTGLAGGSASEGTSDETSEDRSASTSSPYGDDRQPHPGPDPVYARSPRAVVLALVSGLATVLVVGLVHLLNRADAGLRADVAEAVEALPSSLEAVVDALAMTVAGAMLLGTVAHELVARRPRAAASVVVAAMVAALGPWLASLAGAGGRWVGPEGWGLGETMACAAAGGAFAGCALVTGSRWSRYGLVLAGALFLAGGAWEVESVAGRLVWLLAGCAIGALVLAALGTPSQRATAADLLVGLAEAGMPARRVEPFAADARGSVPWMVELESGTVVFAKTATAEERSADLLFRLWRRIQLKDSGDDRPSASLQHAAEHEALVGTRATAAGVRTPRVLGLGRLPEGGVFSLHERVDGRSIDAVVTEDGPDALGEAALREAWSMVATLHRARIAHRDLRGANLILDVEGNVWIVDFAFADVAASEEACRRDLVELLASTAALVGPAAAVDAAVTTLGEAVWLDALPFVQPLATSAATRAQLGPDGFRDLRARLVARTQSPKPDLPRLARIDRRALFSVVALGVAVWTLLPQLSASGDVWEQIPRADPTRLGLAAAFSVLTYVMASVSLHGAVPRSLPVMDTLASQLASSFANRVTPAKVGGLALNVRWMVKRGVEAPVAAAGVSVNAFSGLIVHVLLTVFVLLWAGQAGLGDIETPPARTIGTALGLVAAVLAVTYAIPPLRRTIRHRMWPRTRQSLRAVAEVAAAPRRLVLLFGGSLGVTACYIAALALSVAAVGEQVPLATIALVYLAGSAIASAAPTPGGLGATEATFAAALSGVGLDPASAVSAVLLYRLVTFWLPILPGWMAYTSLRRREQL